MRTKLLVCFDQLETLVRDIDEKSYITNNVDYDEINDIGKDMYNTIDDIYENYIERNVYNINDLTKIKNTIGKL